MSSSARAGGLIAGAAVLLAGGCVGYRLGTTLPADVKTIHVPTFVNRSGEPLLENEATRATRQAFQQDGALRLAREATAADLVLTTTLTRLKLEPLRYRQDRPRATREYRVLVEAEIVAVRTRPAGVLVQRKVAGEATFEFGGDLATAKATALPLAAADLAHQIVRAVAESW